MYIFKKQLFKNIICLLFFIFIIDMNTVVPIYKLICRMGQCQALNFEQHGEHSEEKQASCSAYL